MSSTHDHNHHPESQENGGVQNATPSSGFGGIAIPAIIIIILLMLAMSTCNSCDGCGGKQKCYDTTKESVEWKRFQTPYSIAEKDLPGNWNFDSFGPIYYLRPKPGGKYDTIPYAGGGLAIDYQQLYGPRGHGDLKFIAQDPTQAVTVIFRKEEWIKKEVPCNDGD